ncbi:expansin family [Fusarium denticulatum]|uniref:Expansin family n=1 Tax=Fusarium denticulatum TaxID=48507 RepID=A0A8H5X4R8_9HYPO|nr:expansin family [Fusarium denticulatum]
MYLSKVSTALLSLAIGIQDVAAGPCKPESSQILVESSLGATSSVFDPTSTATSIVSSTETTQTLPDSEISPTDSLDSSSAEGASATTTEETASSAATTEASESITILPSTTTEEAPNTSTAPANEQPQIFTGGFATWVFQNGIMGDCGSVSHDTDFVVALDYRRYDRSKCGQKIRVTATSGRHIGLSIDVTIVDACYACVNENSMDLSTVVAAITIRGFFNFSKAEYTRRSSSFDLDRLHKQEIVKRRQITATLCRHSCAVQQLHKVGQAILSLDNGVSAAQYLARDTIWVPAASAEEATKFHAGMVAMQAAERYPLAA